MRPIFVAARPAIGRLQLRARKQNPKYSPPKFLDYYFLYLRPRSKLLEVASDLRQRPTVELVYEDMPTGPASLGPSKQKCSSSSGHIGGLSEGVNARFAWAIPGGKGDAQFLVDVEKGWTPEHDRLPKSKIHVVVGLSELGAQAHGTSVLGIVCGKHLQSGGCEGIAPEVKWVGLASPVPDPNAPASQPRVRRDDPATALRENIYDAIAIAINKLVHKHDAAPQNGYGVLLLEQQTSQGLPVETYEGIDDLIALATHGLNITVVEPAGNGGLTGGLNLDTHPGAQTLQQDSGAIMVGSASRNLIPQPAPGHHARLSTSNFGSRVNCYAWGERVVTPAWQFDQSGNLGILNECDDQFGHTSAASAIIAGVALIAQGISAHRRRAARTAYQLRAILADPTLGTPCAPGDRIGIMPDLQKIEPRL